MNFFPKKHSKTRKQSSCKWNHITTGQTVLDQSPTICEHDEFSPEANESKRKKKYLKKKWKKEKKRENKGRGGGSLG